MKKDFNRVPRTKSYKSENEFDTLISDIEVSGLVFLREKYIKEKKDFPNHFDLNNPLYQEEYQRILKHISMISQELEHRGYDMSASTSYTNTGEYIFDPETGLVRDGRGNVLYSICYNEDETEIIYDSFNSEPPFEQEYDSDNLEVRRRDVYKDWNYVDDITETES